VSQNIEEPERSDIIAQLETMKNDFTRSINAMQSALLDEDLAPHDNAHFRRSVTIIQHMVDSIAKAMDKVAIKKMEDQF